MNYTQILKHTPYIFLITLALIVFITVAYNSSGYHHEDEHYQLIEFANYKLGLLEKDQLAWEFHSEIRPGLQPLICYIIFRICNRLGISDGYWLVFILRLISAGGFLYILNFYIKSHLKFLEPCLQRWFIGTSLFLCFLPYINVRFSSENWSGALFLIPLSLVVKSNYSNNSKKFFLIGAFLGFSVLFRYQSSFLVLGFYLWLIFINKEKLKHLICLSAAFCIILIFGVGLDFWLYGKFTISMYNYFHVNLIQNVSASFGVAPWYEYFLLILNSSGLFGIFVIASFALGAYYYSRNVIIWSVIPFIFVHFVIPHKELRFMYPIANLVPILFFLMLQKFNIFLNKSRLKNAAIYSIVTILLLYNTIALCSTSLSGAGNGKTSVTEFIHRNYDEKTINIIQYGDLNVYIDWGPPKNSYYSSEGLHTNRISSLWNPDFLKHKIVDRKNLLVIYNNDISGPKSVKLMRSLGLRKVFQNVPGWLEMLYEIYNPNLKDSIISVYEFS